MFYAALQDADIGPSVTPEPVRSGLLLPGRAAVGDWVVRRDKIPGVWRGSRTGPDPEGCFFALLSPHGLDRGMEASSRSAFRCFRHPRLDDSLARPLSGFAHFARLNPTDPRDDRQNPQPRRYPFRPRFRTMFNDPCRLRQTRSCSALGTVPTTCCRMEESVPRFHGPVTVRWICGMEPALGRFQVVPGVAFAEEIAEGRRQAGDQRPQPDKVLADEFPAGDPSTSPHLGHSQVFLGLG